jgi:hypothetical protein
VRVAEVVRVDEERILVRVEQLGGTRLAGRRAARVEKRSERLGAT